MLVSKPEFADIFIVWDVHNLIGRCEGIGNTFTNAQGYPTNGIDIGISKIKAMAEHAGLSSKRVCLVFSAQENKGVRLAVYPKYKEGRVKAPPLFIEADWLDGIRRKIRYDGVRDFMMLVQNIPSLTIGMPNNDGETDDAIASFCHVVAPKPCYVVTEDRDMWSLMSDRVQIFSKPDKVYGIDDLTKKFYITKPTKLGLAKALLGDTSDKIDPTVPGVGPTAIAHDLEACNVQHGDKCWADAFFRQIEPRRGERKIDMVLNAKEEIRFAERWIRLRKVDLSYRYGSRDVHKFKQTIEWFGIRKKFEGFMKFAIS